MSVIAIFAVLCWVVALFYYHWRYCENSKYKNTFGLKIVAVVILEFVAALIVLRLLTGVDRTTPAETFSHSNGLSTLQWAVIVVIALLASLFFMMEITKIISRFWKENLYWQVGGRLLAGLIIAFLIINQIFLHNVYLNNFFILFIVLISFEFALRLTKPAFIGLFAIIMLADIYLVWMVASDSATDAGKSWYVRMFFQSEFFKHFPFPIGLRWKGRVLGNGDIFFMTMAVMYAKRVWSLRAAIIAGIIMTLPIVLLPLAEHFLSNPPLTWPYTIFIAPVALVIAFWRKDDRMLPSVS